MEESFSFFTIVPENNENIVLFISQIGDRSYLVLGGAKSNVTGANVKLDEKSSSSFSYEFDIIKYLKTLLDSTFEGINYEKDEITKEIMTMGKDLATTQFDHWKFGSLFNITNHLVQYSEYPPKNFSFLAKNFTVTAHEQKDHLGNLNHYKLIIGSPIYIADANS